MVLVLTLETWSSGRSNGIQSLHATNGRVACGMHGSLNSAHDSPLQYRPVPMWPCDLWNYCEWTHLSRRYATAHISRNIQNLAPLANRSPSSSKDPRSPKCVGFPEPPLADSPTELTHAQECDRNLQHDSHSRIPIAATSPATLDSCL